AIPVNTNSSQNEPGIPEIAELLLRLRPKQARKLLRDLDDTKLLSVSGTMDASVIERLLDDALRDRIAHAAANLDTEEAADLFAQAPENLGRDVLSHAPENKRLRANLSYAPDSAGAIMQHRLVAAPQNWTIGQLVEEIREQAEVIDKLYAAYIVDDEGRLTGYLKIRDLLLSPTEARVGDLARPDPAAVRVDTDREDVLRIAKRQRLKVLPVLDSEEHLVGMVTADELRKIERAEADEDMKLMAGLDPEATSADGPLRILKSRLPWLAAGLVGAGIAALVVGSYEDALTEAAILAALIPIVMSLAGNSGIQASTVTVQAMSAGALWTGDLLGRILREFGGALLNGAVVGCLVTVCIIALSGIVEIDRPYALAATAALTLIAVTVQAAVVGSMIPIALDRLKFDPAVATGVFITTSNDVVGVLIFFLVASNLYF
ncbi:MAG: magnesium transporter, partial [Rhizobiaceae bacterium]